MKKYIVAAVCLLCIVTVFFVFKNVLLISSGNSYQPDGGILNRIESTKMRNENGRTYFGKAWKERRDGYNLVSIEGDPYEMGYQHGILLKEEIGRGVVPLFADFLSHMNQYRNKPRIVRWLIRLYLEITVFRPLENSMPEEYLQELKGIADASGIDFDNLFIATFKSELSMIMTGNVITGKVNAFGVTSECSGFAASGPATDSGKLIVGRNTDYAGQGRWMSNQTVFIYRPEAGNAYVNITTAGIIKCNVAMNAQGMVIGGHFMSFSGTTVDGLPFTILQHEIMRRTSTLEEAIALLRNSRRSTCFGFLIADGMNRKAAVVETNGPLLGVKYQEKGYIALSNSAITGELKEVDLCAKYNLVMRDLLGRRARLNQLIEENYGSITPGMAAAFMGDHVVAKTGKERVTGGTVGNVNTVTSAVFIPEDGILWFGKGEEPACGNVYVPLDVRSLLKDAEPRNLDPLEGYRWKNPSLEAAMKEYLQSFIKYSEDPDDVDAIALHLDKAVALDGAEPIYRRVKALLLLNAGRYGSLESTLAKPEVIGTELNDQAMHHFIYGMGYDLANERAKAVSHYTEVVSLGKEHGVSSAEGINKLLFGMAQKFIDKKFTRSGIPDIPVGFDGTSGLE